MIKPNQQSLSMQIENELIDQDKSNANITNWIQNDYCGNKGK